MWPKGITTWHEGRTLMVSVPFTWNLPKLRRYLQMGAPSWDSAIVGGPAVMLMPEYLKGLGNVSIGHDYPGVLQRVNPEATRTTRGCIRHCSFCGIGTGKIESGGFEEIQDYPDRRIICDNNLLASSLDHFDRVMDRLEKHAGVDFNQGLDARLLTMHHAVRFSRLKRPQIRLACDSMKNLNEWLEAKETLLQGGVKKSWIGTYALIGFDAGPDEAWKRCEFIRTEGRVCYPMWFHELYALKWNAITQKQIELGWNKKERTQIMRRFYKAKVGGFINHAQP